MIQRLTISQVGLFLRGAAVLLVVAVTACGMASGPGPRAAPASPGLDASASQLADNSSDGVAPAARAQPTPEPATLPIPAEYFPSPEELPAGFVHLPGLGIVEQGPDVSTISRLYV